MNFSQYLNELEGKAKAEISENKDSLTNEISQTKNVIIILLRGKYKNWMIKIWNLGES